MKGLINAHILLLAATVFCSCKQKLKAVPYIQYVQDEQNGLKKTVTIGIWQYSFQYKPADYIMLMEHKPSNANFDFEKRRKNLNRTAWFNISFKLENGTVSPLRYNLTSKEEYDQRLNYFLNGAVHDISLLYNHTDTLHPIGYLFENNYNLTPQETMVVGFDLPGEAGTVRDMQLSYSDRIFRNGIIKVSYKKEDLNKVPNLN